VAKRKKSKIPPPPRPVQAPKKRVEPRDPRRTRMVLVVLGAALVVAAAVVGIALAFGGGGGESSGGGCGRRTFADQGRRHVSELPKGFKYNSFPPTSGPHYPQPNGPAIWNIYDEPVPQLALVHNLEHGGIVVQYGDQVPAKTVQEIADWYAGDPLGLVVAPLPALKKRIALTAWTHLMTCSKFDENAYSDFRDDFRGKGPENQGPTGIPPESLQPGTQ
jgi:hypothetical protein